VAGNVLVAEFESFAVAIKQTTCTFIQAATLAFAHAALLLLSHHPQPEDC
jgi:hypothetical protein